MNGTGAIVPATAPATGSPEATVVEYLKSLGSIEQALASGKIKRGPDGGGHYDIVGSTPKLPGATISMVVDNGDGTISAQIDTTTGNGMPPWWKGETNLGNQGGNAGAKGDHGHINMDGSYGRAHG